MFRKGAKSIEYGILLIYDFNFGQKRLKKKFYLKSKKIKIVNENSMAIKY